MEKKKSNQLSNHKKPEWKTTRNLDFKPTRSQELENKETWTHSYTLGEAQKVEWQNNAHNKVEWKSPKQRNNQKFIKDLEMAKNPNEET